MEEVFLSGLAGLTRLTIFIGLIGLTGFGLQWRLGDGWGLFMTQVMPGVFDVEMGI